MDREKGGDAEQESIVSLLRLSVPRAQGYK